jgi:hypothetical protein
VLHATQGTLLAALANAIHRRQRTPVTLRPARRQAPGLLAGRAGRGHQIEPARPIARAFVDRAVLGIDGQWQRAAESIRAALASFRNIRTFQAAAARQIDAADYALQLLIQDLSAAMPIPADGRELRAVLAEAAKAQPSRAKKALAA